MASRYTPQRVARLVKNPGTRATVPTKYLPAKYRRQRELNARLAAPVVEGSSLTNRDAARERNAQVSLRYSPLEGQLTQQLQRSQQVQQAIPQWYDQYRQQLAAEQDGVRTGYDAAVKQMQGLQQGTLAATANPQIQAQNAEIAQLGGVQDTQQAQIASQAAATRAAMAGNLGGVIAAQGANQNAYGQNLIGNTGAHQIESILSELGNERNIRSDRSQLAREKGAFSLTQDQTIRDRERKNVLENAAFNLDVANTTADNARADQQARDQRRQQRATQRRQQQADEFSGPGAKYGYSTSAWRKMTTAQRQQVIREFNRSSKGGGGSKPGKPRQEPATSLNPRRTINSRVDFVKQYARDNHLSLADRAQRARLVASLRRTHPGYFDNGGNERMLSAALDLAQGRKISSENLRYLRKQGIYVTSTGDYWRGGNR